MVISLYPGQAAEEVEKQVTIPVERALIGVPRVLVQRSITSFGLSQVILTFEDDVDIYFARQQVAERLPDAEVPDGRRAAPRPQRHAGRADLPVHAGERPPHAQRAAQLAGLGGVEAPDARARRRRRGQLRRLPEGVPRPRRPGAAAQQRPDAARTSSTRSRRRTARRRAATCSTARRSSWCAARGYLRTPRDIENTVVRATERHAGPGAQRRQGRRGVHAAARARWRAARPSTPIEGTVLLRRGENPQGRADRRARGRRPHQPRRPAAGDAHRPVLRPHAAGRHHAARRSRTTCSRARCWSAWCCGCSCARVSGSLAVAVTMPLALLTAFVGPLLRGRAGQPAVDGGDRLRHPARRRGDPGRERLPPPGRGAAAARGGARTSSPSAAKEVRAADPVLDVDHRRGDDADLHAGAGRGAHLPARWR